MLTEKSRGIAPAILFDDIPGYPKGFRTLYGHFSSIRRVALTLGLPLEYGRKVDVVKMYHERMRSAKLLPPRWVNDGPFLENVIEGDKVDVLKFPVPRHHELDKARYIGTANCVITQDPDAGWFNLGTYRNQVYDGRTIGCQITEGKHGRIHRDKYFERGQSMKAVVLPPIHSHPLARRYGAQLIPNGDRDSSQGANERVFRSRRKWRCTQPGRSTRPPLRPCRRSVYLLPGQNECRFPASPGASTEGSY